MVNYIADITNELYRWFDIINTEKFNGELPIPVLTIADVKNTKGHCSKKKFWIEKDYEEVAEETNNAEGTNDTNSSSDNSEEQEDNGIFYEINLVPKYFDEENLYSSVEVLAHEMVHLYNIIHGIKDCSGKKHNKKFLAACEHVGLTADKDDKWGYAYTYPTESFNNMVTEKIKPNWDVFKYCRVVPEDPKKDNDQPKKRFVGWVCPECGREAKFEEGLENVLCGDCNVPFELKPKGKRGRKPKD